MQFDNEMKIRFLAKSENESFARIVVAAFLSHLDPMLSDVEDIKTAVSEAVTNSIIHGYENQEGFVNLYCGYVGDKVYIKIQDSGKGILDISKAREPLYTSKPELERAGMGFTVMETFMDEISVESEKGRGTTVNMIKKLHFGSNL